MSHVHLRAAASIQARRQIREDDAAARFDVAGGTPSLPVCQLEEVALDDASVRGDDAGDTRAERLSVRDR